MSAHPDKWGKRLTHDGADPIRPSGKSTIDSETRNPIDILEIESFEKRELLWVEDLSGGCRGHLLDDDMSVSDDSPKHVRVDTLYRRSVLTRNHRAVEGRHSN